MNKPTLTVSSSPHLHAKTDTASIMWIVSLALAPATLWGVYVFGLRSALVLAVAIASSLLCEFLLGKVSKESTLWDGSAFLTGLLVGLNMSPSVPLFIPFLASAFAIFVAKWVFGGLGANWANPALAGRVFVFFSFTTPMSSYVTPKTLASAMPDALASATPLGFAKTAIASGTLGMDANALLEGASYPATSFAQSISSVTGFSAYSIDSFLGNVAGCIGEVSALALLIGGIFLLVSKIITWHIPVTYLLSVGVFSWIFGGIPSANGAFSGSFFPSMFSGGLMLGALFMATDYVTSPISHKGQIVYGLGCGFFTFLFRYFGSMPEAVSVSILLMNILTPTIDRYIIPRKFGDTRELRKKQKEAKV
ncbi:MULTISPECIES: RnfABCDGE type electron transport complex subunit D [Sphaerochaeta]|jgi:electron transport complex protein RnfD|uniref:Ion-translocating oxidoreductase complex subunit D n=2 Tax=root TaxID=1 RepID=A0ABY4DI81_9SPIR|nr:MULTISPECIES: RnfABCDGE type electron transport complex subunit D [Sphaerochaeta]MDT3357861.1 RnfABCDGE type electron transport complex subunit D [Spirochaetota bacterium]NLA98313.1 RnfABCDGE type electron transport complex subunit D [Spirochaetales bacterium]MDD3455315.1 RnfABCDGE type electron transport complex subunit D [Sphaerochaeta sp.]MDD4036788.1 RnfABCDGE type electron transport complex subunit D [Sphaerochaeta sp.]MDX9982726.1 RnfABCDGE type electron transport complex subunit D [S